MEKDRVCKVRLCHHPIRDEDVMNNLDSVVLYIDTWIKTHYPAKVPSSPDVIPAEITIVPFEGD